LLKKRFALNRVTYFISDLHLGLENRQKEEEKESLLLSFLNNLPAEKSEVFIIGDFFDYWFEYRQVLQKGFYRVFAALRNFIEKGGVVNYLIGNHDFMHRDFFSKELNVHLVYDSIEVKIGDKLFFISHGDDYLKNDFGYKILKKVLRNKVAQFFYSLVHPDLGIKIARIASKSSREYTQKKDYGGKDYLLEFAQKKIDEGVDFVIMGHTHNRKIVKYKDGVYVNLGSWIQQPCYCKFEENNFEVIDLK